MCDCQGVLDRGRTVRLALGHTVYGVGGDPAPFLPVDTSDGGRAIDSTLLKLQTDLATLGAGGFTHAFLLPTSALDANGLQLLLGDTVFGFGIAPFQDTRKRLRYFPGDAELSAKYRLVTSGPYSAAVAVVVRLPTGHLDSPNDLLDVATGDHQTDLEARVTQELLVGGRLWLNLSVRAAQQRPGQRERRLAPPEAFLVPFAARAVGSVLHHTPARAGVPCQRVVNRWGRLAPTYGWGGMEQHKQELEAENVRVRPDYTVDLKQYQWWPDPRRET